MQPVREGSHELEAAHEQAAALREELTERTRDVRKLAELLAQERAATAEMQRRLDAVQRVANQPGPMPARVSHGGFRIGGGLIAALAVVVVALLLASGFRNEHSQERKTNELGLGHPKGESAAVVPKSRNAPPVSKPYRLPRRVRVGGASGDRQSIRQLSQPHDEQLGEVNNNR